MKGPRFLLVTDTHFAEEGSPLRLDDLSKSSVPAIVDPTRESEMAKLFGRLAADLRRKGETLDGVLFAGDAQRRGLPGGHRILLDQLLEHFGDLGIDRDRIVATPGNHDIKKGSDPASTERYAEFAEIWRKEGCIVPWLDGVDDRHIYDRSRHFLTAEDKQWVVVPLNTSNWSQIRARVPEALEHLWDKLPDRLSKRDDERKKIRTALDSLLAYDMAHISDHQLEVLRSVINTLPQPEFGPQLRILLMHHHLRAPSLRIELKPFDNITNIEQVRHFIQQSGFGLILHGHKHEHAIRFEHLEGPGEQEARQVAVLSAGAIDDGREGDAARILTVSGLPYTPELSSQRYGLVRGGLNAATVQERSIRLWTEPRLPGAPITIQGTDFDSVYARACHAAGNLAPRGTLVVHLDLPGKSGRLDLPRGYPAASAASTAEREKWLEDIVGWWQLPHSHRDKSFPYPHGSRLRKYGGITDQIDRLGEMLEATHTSPTLSSRALAILVDPIRDFENGNDTEAFPSFSMLQLKKRSEGGKNLLDIIGFYRAQEFSQWWPVNIAELRAIQVKLCERARTDPGRITTVTTEARLDDKAPGQVHIPIFDRWLDQTPENLFLLATFLAGHLKDHPEAETLHRQWQQGLRDLETVAKAPSIDGSPISSKGLRTLRDYLASVCPDATSRPACFTDLDTLVDQTESFEATKKDAHHFELWAKVVKRVVPNMIENTRQ